MAMNRDQQHQPPTDLEKRLCAACGSSERWFLHYARYKGAFCKLCTHCVLKHNPGLFCPICLHYYDVPPPARDRVMCLRCPSISHSTCVAANSSFHGFQCPPCSQPTFSFFKLNRRQNDNCGGDANANATLLVNRDAAKALFAAARVAAYVMGKAASVARLDAEKRVKEALAGKKRAREALERLASLVSKQKEKEEKAGGEGVVVGPPVNLRLKPKLEGPDSIQPKMAETEGSNGLRRDQVKINHGDPEED